MLCQLRIVVGGLIPVQSWKKRFANLPSNRMMCRLRIAVCENIMSVKDELQSCSGSVPLAEFIDCAIYGTYVFAQSKNIALIRDHEDDSRKREAKAYQKWFDNLWSRGGQSGNDPKIVVSKDIRSLNDVQTFSNSLAKPIGTAVPKS
jgi:hypothetical protein